MGGSAVVVAAEYGKFPKLLSRELRPRNKRPSGRTRAVRGIERDFTQTGSIYVADTPVADPRTTNNLNLIVPIRVDRQMVAYRVLLRTLEDECAGWARQEAGAAPCITCGDGTSRRETRRNTIRLKEEE